MAPPQYPTKFQLPGLEYPVKRSPMWSTLKQDAVDGARTRLQLWAAPLYKYELSYSALRSGSGLTELQTLLGFYNSVGGPAGVFGFFDENDWNPMLSQGINNLFPFSVPTANWSGAQASVSANALTDPLGGSTGGYLVDDNTTNTHIVYNPIGRLLPNTKYVASCYLKAGTKSQAAINVSDGSTFVIVIFNLSTGAVVTQNADVVNTIYSAGASSAGGGWFRCFIVFSFASPGLTATALGAQGAVAGAITYAGTNDNAVGVWGMQLEAYPVDIAVTGPSTYVSTTSGGALFGTGDGTRTQFQLGRTLGGFSEPVFLPAGGNAASNYPIYNNGAWVGSGYTVANGIVTFGSAPAAGHSLTWVGDYTWPCQFDEDSEEFDNFMYQLFELKQITFTTWRP